MLLVKGQTFKNYKVLCEYLGEPIKIGVSRQNQIAHWKTCFTHIRRGQAYIIEEVMQQVTERIPTYEKNSKWNKEIAVQLFMLVKDIVDNKTESHYLAPNELVLTSMQGYAAVGLCNNKLRTLKTTQAFPEVSMETQLEFYSEVKNKFYFILRDVLTSLSHKKILTHEKTYVVMDGVSHRVATFEEKTIIDGAKKKALVHFEAANEFMIIAHHKEKVFYEYVEELLIPEGIVGSYAVNRIGFVDGCLEHFARYIVDQAERDLAKSNINEKAYNDIKGLIEGIISTKEYAELEYNPILEQQKYVKLLNHVIPLEK